MRERGHQEFIRFLNALERDIPAGKTVHVILHNYAAHKHAKLTRRRLKHGVFHSILDLQAAINRFLAERNRSPTPFIRRADPDAIIAARNRGFQTLEPIH